MSKNKLLHSYALLFSIKQTVMYLLREREQDDNTTGSKFSLSLMLKYSIALLNNIGGEFV